MNEIKNKIVFKIKIGYKLELLSNQTMQLLASSKRDIHRNKNGEIMLRIEAAEVVLLHCNLTNNNYRKTSKILFTFTSHKQFG